MVKPTTHAAVISQWPTIAAFARAIGVSARNAGHMARRGIPAKRYDDVVAAVARAGFSSLTYQDLTAMAAAQKETTHGR